LFEKNGFIVQLDLWVFEQVCRTLRLWLDRGLTPMRISVNCSRVHLKMPGFLAQYCLIADRYAVPHQLLEIEVTENVVFEDVHYLTQIISGIHAAGFSCSMDDFGSGYSSLNLIQDIPVDVLKLDKIFFRSNAHGLGRTESVVGSIIAMARALSMETVAEGVEERHQVDMLRRLGCDYIQGYYFARPMSIPDFEVLAFGALQTSEVP
ncbi:MAG: EAL domain-containing protein, partial [Oscillospiraceae bacterium]